MKRSITHNLTLILSVLAMIAAALLYAYLYASFQSLRKDTADLYSKAAQSKAAYDELAKVRMNLKSTLGSEDRLTSLFVQEESVVDFIEVLEDVMETAGVNGSVDSASLRQSEELDKAGMKELYMTVSVSGSWTSIMRFEGLLLLVPYKMSVDAFNMAYKQDKSGSLVWNATFNLHSLVIRTKDETN